MRSPVLSPYRSLVARNPVIRRAVDVDGLQTRYWEYGPSDAERTVLAVHGFRGDHHGLESIVAHMPTLRVIVPDLPGFGESAPLERSDLASYARWLPRFRSAAGLDERSVVLAHSFGTTVASAAAAEGMRTPLLALVNPIGAPALEGPRRFGTAAAVGYYRLGATLPKPLGLWLLRNAVVVRGMSITMAKTHDPAMRRWIHDQHDHYFSAFSDRTSVLQAFQASVSHDVSEYAEALADPVLLIAGARDDITAVPEQRALESRIRDAELIVLDGVGHLTHYETPGAVAAAVLHRLGRLAAR